MHQEFEALDFKVNKDEAIGMIAVNDMESECISCF